MEVSYNNPLLNSATQANQNETRSASNGSVEPVSVKKTAVEQTPEGPIRKTYDFVFANADDKFMESFSKMTSNLTIMDASFMKTKVEVNLINYHKEQITTEVKSKMGDDFELTEEMKQKIFNEAKERAETEGFSNINMNNFLSYITKNTAQNPLLASDNTFFTQLHGTYNSVSIDSRG